jgi:hypothetical protein
VIVGIKAGAIRIGKQDVLFEGRTAKLL